MFIMLIVAAPITPLIMLTLCDPRPSSLEASATTNVYATTSGGRCERLDLGIEVDGLT